MNDGRKVEGTFVLDGLLEGHVGSEDERDRLRAWVDAQHERSLHFALELDGASFSLLPSKEPVRSLALGPDPGRRVEQALGELLRELPVASRGELYSTLHGVEVRPGQEVQTVYALTADGGVRREERVVDADTEAPSKPPSTRTLVRRALAGLGVVAVLFALSSIFVDWGGTFRGLWHQVSPLSSKDVTVDASAFAPWFVVEKHEIGRDSRVVLLSVKRTGVFPIDGSTPPPTSTWRETLVRDSIGRGWLRAEVFDEKGEFIGASDVRISALREKETAELKVPVPREPRPKKIVLIP